MYTKEQVIEILEHILEYLYVSEDEKDEIIALFMQPCDIPGCNGYANWEGWIGNGLIRKVCVCDEHKKLLRGYEEK